MLAGISDEHQVEKMILNLKDPKSFWRHDVFPSLAANVPGYKPSETYWAGAVWAPTNAMIIKGLDCYSSVEGEDEFAAEAAKRYLNNIYDVYKASGTIWQNYSSESSAHGKFCKPDYVGWSGLGPIQLLIEDVLGIKANALEKRIDWRLRRTDRHGIEHLQFGDICASLVASRRDNLNSPVEFTVTTDKPFELCVYGQTSKVFQVLKGTHSYRL